MSGHDRGLPLLHLSSWITLSKDPLNPVERHFLWRVELGGERRAAIAAVAPRRGAGNRRDDPGCMIDRAQAAALAFEDVDGTVCPDLDGAGAEGSGSGRLPAVTAVLGGA